MIPDVGVYSGIASQRSIILSLSKDAPACFAPFTRLRTRKLSHLRIRTLLRVAVLGLALALLFASAALAQRKPKIVLVIADRLVPSDVYGLVGERGFAWCQYELRTARRLEGDRRCGLLGPIPVGRRNPHSQYASVSAGCPCRAESFIGEGYSLDEQVEGATAAVVYQRRTGLRAPPGSVVHLQTGPIFRANEKLYNPTQVGYLGETLKKAGIRVAVFGNSDLPGLPYRPAVAIAMDQNGVVPMGDVSARCLCADPSSPAGIITDVPKLAAMVKKALASVDFVVVDFGDTTRLEVVRPFLSPSAYERYRVRALGSLEQFMRTLRMLEPAPNEIWRVSLSPRLSESGEWDSLAPITICAKAGYGLRSMFSDTTRTPGLVTAIDIAPTILRAYGVSPTETIGRPIVPAKSKVGPILARLDTQSRLIERAQLPILGAFAALGVIVITIATVVVTFLVRCSPFTGALLRFLVLCLAGAPLAMLVAPSFRADTTGKAGLVVALCTLAVAATSRLAGWAIQRWTRAAAGDLSLAAAQLGTALCLIVVGLTGLGSSNLRFSMVSGSLIGGTRYYGIGNEYMGVLVGGLLAAALWFAAAFAGSRRARILNAAINLLFVLAILALSPSFGANTGGLITAVVTFGLAIIAIGGRRFGLRQAVLLTVLGAALAVALGVLDIVSRGSNGSHLGRALAGFSDGRLPYLAVLAGRKLLMNVRLLGTRQATTALLAFLPFFVLWFSGTQRRVDDFLQDRPRLRWGLIAGLIGAVAAFLLNDSGIVSAFLILACLVQALLYSMLESRKLIADIPKCLASSHSTSATNE